MSLDLNTIETALKDGFNNINPLEGDVSDKIALVIASAVDEYLRSATITGEC